MLRSIGLPIAYSKIQMPAPVTKYLGIVIDLPRRQLSIPMGKIQEFLEIVTYMARQTTVNLKMLQSFVWRVNYLSKVVPPARLFIARTLQLLHNNFQQHTIEVDARLQGDMRWFARFLTKYNGISVIPSPNPTKTILADSCLTAGGATDYSRFYEFIYPERVAQEFHISVLEALKYLIALSVLLNDSDNHLSVRLCCDSLVTVLTLTTGWARDPALSAIARAVWFIQAQRHIIDRRACSGQAFGYTW